MPISNYGFTMSIGEATELELKRLIAANIQGLRKLKGLTQSELGLRVSLDSSVVAKVESGFRSVSAPELWKFAAALDVDIGRLYDYPGAREDRFLVTLVLTPQRELQAHLDAIRHFIDGTGEGALQTSVSRINDGVEEYRAKVPDPYLLTASPELVDRALGDAIRVWERQRALRDELSAALNKFEGQLAESISNPEMRQRAGRHHEAREVRDRGASDD